MTGRTDFITTAPWEDVMLIWYVLIDDGYQALEAQSGPWRQRGPAPLFSDSEVITVGLLIDTIFHGHAALGLAFLRRYHPDLFPHLPPDGWFNQRRRILGPLIDQIRRLLSRHYGLISDTDQVRLLDSAPISITTYTRGKDNRTVTGSEYFGVAPSKGAKLYGFRLHLTATTDQVVDDWLLAPASYHDSTVMPAVFEQAHDLLVLGDGAFHHPALEPVWQEQQQIEILAPPRKDSRQPWPKGRRRWIGRMRRRIETVFSVLSTVFHIEQPGAHSLAGLVSRLSTRLLAYNLCFIMGPLLAELGSKTPN
jgi:hypothetical protein